MAPFSSIWTSVDRHTFALEVQLLISSRTVLGDILMVDVPIGLECTLCVTFNSQLAAVSHSTLIISLRLTSHAELRRRCQDVSKLETQEINGIYLLNLHLKS